MLRPDLDVLVVGSGLAGATTATLLSRQGLRVGVVDRWPSFPPCFKAEKVEPDQVELLRKFGLLEGLLSSAVEIKEILRARNGRVLRRVPTEQYGIAYQDLVNAARAAMPAEVSVRTGRVTDITTGIDVQHVKLADGGELTARLVVLACGTGGDLQTRLGLEKHTIRREQSLAFGFTIARPNGEPFGFDSVTYYPDSGVSSLAYLTLFLMGPVMRANMFAYWGNASEQTKQFLREPRAELTALLPGLSRVIGDFSVVTPVESSRIDLYRIEAAPRPGLVLVADAFQSVCPTTGSGLSKVLTDVDVLCHQCAPRWFATPGMGIEKIETFYQDARKCEVDRLSLAGAAYTRRLNTDRSLPWRLRRLRWRWDNRPSRAPEPTSGSPEN